MPPLPSARASCAAVAAGDELIVLGGCDVDGEPLKSGVRLVGHEWVAIPPLARGREGFGLVVAHGHLVAVGGRTSDLEGDSVHTSSVEMIPVEQLDSCDFKWVAGPSMRHSRRFACVVGGPAVGS